MTGQLSHARPATPQLNTSLRTSYTQPDRYRKLRRKPSAGLEPVGEHVEQQAVGTSRSAVSRRFVQATAERLAELLARRLDDRRFMVVFLDGFGMGEHLLVGALGVAADGTKVPLGVAEGTTENTAVCTRLVADLADRGLDASKGVLFVIDGGKALERAIRAVFGAKALIQRCRQHKERINRPSWLRQQGSPDRPLA
jgi:putative transposase